MWRACVLAAVVIGAAPAALACEDPYNIRGIIYSDIPAGTPQSTTILEVNLSVDNTDLLVANVTRVVQGAYAEPSIRIGILNSSCLNPRVFGEQGLIIGELRKGAIRTNHGPVALTLGFEGVWFRPNTESVAERRNRTGIDALTQ